MSDCRTVERFEDMSPQGRLKLTVQPDGDIIINVIPDVVEGKQHHLPPFGIQIEFCTPYSGGGQSPKTIKALRDLFEAMEADNKENPQYRG